jgi:hypothetical protein
LRKADLLRYADGSNPLHWAESSIKWRHEGFGVKKGELPSGVAVPGERALSPCGFAADGGADHRRFNYEDNEHGQGESNSDEGKIHSRDSKGEHVDGAAQEAH